MKKNVKNLILLVFLSLLPTLAWSQTEGVTYKDDAPTSISSNGDSLTFTVTAKTDGMQALITKLSSYLVNLDIGGLDVSLNNPLSPLSGLSGDQLVQGILGFLGVNNPTSSVAIDLNTVYTAAITGPNSFSGPLTIPATVWNVANFNEDNLLNLVISQQGKSGINLGVFDEILNLSLAPDVTLGVLKGLLSITFTGSADGNSGIHVTEIADNAFNAAPAYGYNQPGGNFSLDKAIYLERIGDYAFYNCQNLKGSIDFTKLTNLKEVADNGLYNLRSITGNLDLSNCKQLETIGAKAFMTWSGATGELNISGLTNLKSIGYQAFYMGNFTSGSIDLSASTKLPTIEGYAFSYLRNFAGTCNLSGLTALTSIGEHAFDNCNKMHGGIDLSGCTGLKSIGREAFARLSSIDGTLNFTGLGELTTIGDGAFFSLANVTGGLDLSSCTKLETIGNSAFTGSKNLTGMTGEFNVSGLTNLKSIGDQAFYRMTNVTGDIDLSASKGLTTIGNRAFGECDVDGILNLTGLTNLKSIGPNAFLYLRRITGGVDFSTLANLDSIGAYSFSQSGFNGELKLSGSKITTISDYAFANSYFTGELLIPSSGITTIGNGAFSGCGFTGSVIIPANITNVGDAAFRSLGKLRSISFKAPNLTLGKTVFNGDMDLEYIDLSTTTLSITPTDISRVGDTFTSTSPFCNVSSHTVIYLPAGYSGTMPVAADNYNYVIDGTCDWFYVQDGSDYYLPYGFTAKKATWNIYDNNSWKLLPGRNITPKATRNNFKGVNTVYLPFDFKLTDDTKFMAYSLLEKNNDPTVHEFRFLQHDKNDLLKANTPYVVRYIGTDATTDAFPEQENVNVPATSDCGVSQIIKGYKMYKVNSANVTDSVRVYAGADALANINGVVINDPVQGTWGFYGSTEIIDNTTASGWNAYNYQYSDKMWHPISAGPGFINYLGGGPGFINQFRAFIAGSNNAVGSKPNFTYSFEDLDGSVTTGITNLDGDEPNNDVETRIYNIGGQYVGKDFNSLPKGIYIVNGKKIMK